MNLIAIFITGMVIITIIYYLLIGLIFIVVMVEQLIKKLRGNNNV